MENKIQKNVIIFIIVFLMILGINEKVFAVEITEVIRGIEYSEEYLNWLQLDDEQKVNSIMPRMYKVRKDMSTPLNPIKAANLVGASLETRFDLNTYIKDNLIIKNQGKFGACWAFASLGALETNLAMRDYQNNRATKVYDFSEMHMIYATSTSFKNGEKPEVEFDRVASEGANELVATAYLTNGTGPIEEKYMKYDDTAADIDINDIKNKTLGAQIYDTYEFPSTETMNRDELILLMKEYIKNNGGIYATTHETNEPGGSTASGKCPNPKTGAIYCNNAITHKSNHAILIVGWDDNYNINNFTEGHRPKNNGAWIVRDSHGNNESNLYTFDELKKINYDTNKDTYLKQGLTDYTMIPDDFIVSLFQNSEEYIINKEKREIYYQHNDNGYLYISYEDVNIYSTLMGISKASTEVAYENIYQYNDYGITGTWRLDKNKFYVANVFNKKTAEDEYITQISLETSETVTCKVYVNPKNDYMGEENLQEVTLKTGTTQTIDAGYHTLEFLNPVQITGDKFMIVVEVQGKRSDGVNISLLFNEYNHYKELHGTEPPEGRAVYKNVEIEPGNCYVSLEENALNSANAWIDLGTLSQYNVSDENKQKITLVDSASSIKSFTVTKINADPDPTPPVTPSPSVSPTSTPSPTPSPSPTPTDPVDDKPKNTNFDTANCVLTGIKYYTFSDASKSSYVIMGTAIDGVNMAKGNDEVEYYYYISGNPNETEITDWIKIKEQQLADNKMLFDINTNNVKDVYELGKNEKLYVYIKEVAKKENNESTVVSKSLLVNSNIKNSEIEVYLDNVKVDNSGSGNGEKPTTPTDDPTVSQNKLPYTGVKTIAVIMIIVVGFGVYQYIKYKKLSKYIK